MIKLYNDEELEEDLKYVMRDTTNTLERMIEDAPAELQKSAVSIDFVKDTVKSVIERYQKSLANITQKMNGAFKDPNTAEMASKIEKQIKELQEIYDLELEGQQIEEFMKQIKFSRDDADARTEEVRTNREDELMTFMNESLHSFDALLQLDDIDSDIREINKMAVSESIEIYKRKYAELLEQTGGYYTNPNIMLKKTQIERMIKRLEERYPDRENEPEIDILAEMESSSSKTDRNNDKEEQEVITQRKKQEDELMSFMNETFHAFDTLLELEDIDEDTHDSIKHAASQSIEIYRSKYAQLLEQMGGFSRNPNVMLKQSQINKMIKRLEAQYGVIQPEEQSKDNKSDVQISDTTQPSITQKEIDLDSKIEQMEKENEDVVKESKQELLARLQREYPLDTIPDSDPMKEAFENARMKSMEDLYDEFTRKYSLEGIQDIETLSNKLNDMFLDGADYGCNPKDAERVVRLEFLKHIVPQYSELRSAIITLRGINLELEEQLLGRVDLSNISYQELLNKANALIQEISQPEKTRTKDESIKDEIGDEFQPQTPSEKQSEQEAQVLWMNRLQLSDKTVDRVTEGAQDKREVVKLIQDLEQQMSQDRNEQIQEENQNEGQR